MPSAVTKLGSIAKIADLNSKVNRITEKKSDIRYSRELETIEELKQQNELLKKQVDYWHSQTAVTVGARGADKEEVKKLARQLRRDYGSQTEVEDYLPELQWLADNRQNKKTRFSDMMQTAENVARQVLDGCRVNVNAEQMETMKELKKFLRGRYINVDDSLKEDIGDFGDFKKLNRALHFREDGSGTGVDSLWLELQDQFGKGLFPENVQNPADQIRHIADTVGTMEAQWVNPYDADMELTVQQMAQRRHDCGCNRCRHCRWRYGGYLYGIAGHGHQLAGNCAAAGAGLVHHHGVWLHPGKCRQDGCACAGLAD